SRRRACRRRSRPGPARGEREAPSRRKCPAAPRTPRVCAAIRLRLARDAQPALGPRTRGRQCDQAGSAPPPYSGTPRLPSPASTRESTQRQALLSAPRRVRPNTAVLTRHTRGQAAPMWSSVLQFLDQVGEGKVFRAPVAACVGAVIATFVDAVPAAVAGTLVHSPNPARSTAKLEAVGLICIDVVAHRSFPCREPRSCRCSAVMPSQHVGQ